MLVLDLVQLPASIVTGIYGKTKDQMPDRMRWLHPAAAEAFTAISPWAVVSDMYRSATSSLQAVREGRGAQRPGFSAHGFGLAVDLDISASMKRLGVRKKGELDEAMREWGWYCHRVDGLMGHEAWHNNHIRIGEVVSRKVKSTAGYIEQKIVAMYGPQLAPDDAEAQRMLKMLGLYDGPIDGDIGPLSREATRVFQRAWELGETGKLDPRTRRTLAFVTAVDRSGNLISKVVTGQIKAAA